MPKAAKNGNIYTVASYLQTIKMIESERMDFAILIEPIADEIIEKEKLLLLKSLIL